MCLVCYVPSWLRAEFAMCRVVPQSACRMDPFFSAASYREDIYSFAVNTKNIVIECNENISIFTSAKHE